MKYAKEKRLDIGGRIYNNVLSKYDASVQYGDLRNVALFNSVRTNGINLIFQIPGLIPVTVSTGDFFQLLATNPHKQYSDIVKEEMI